MYKHRISTRFTKPGQLSERTKRRHRAMRQLMKSSFREDTPAEDRVLPRWGALVAALPLLCIVAWVINGIAVQSLTELVQSDPATGLGTAIVMLGFAGALDVLITETRRIEVLFHRTASWTVGETQEQCWSRMRLLDVAASADCYPETYPGLVISVRDIEDVISSKLPSLMHMSDKDHICLTLDLTEAQIAGLRSRDMKIQAERPVACTFEDHYGAIVADLTKINADPAQWEIDEKTRVENQEFSNELLSSTYTQEVIDYKVAVSTFHVDLAAAMESGDELPLAPVCPIPPRLIDVQPSSFDREASVLTKALPPTVTHTGTGLYAAEVTPTKSDDTQSGAVVENLCLRSEEIDVNGSGTPWTHLNTTVTADQTTAPDGVQTADKFTEDATDGSHVVYQSVAHVIGSTYTVSIYLQKGSGRDWAYLFGGGSPASAVAYFDLENGATGQTGGTLSPTSAIVDAGGGWYRCSITYQANITLSTLVGCGMASADGTYSYSGSASNYHYAWGAQCELGASVTAYQKTEAATASQVVFLTTGGLGTADAYKGGYVTNVTRTETRAIIRHIDDSVALEGDLLSWADTDDLDIYDAWSTIQAAHDQLYTDQGATAFTATQTIRSYAGTYTENVTVQSALGPQDSFRCVIEGNSGDTVVVQNTGAAHTFTHSNLDLRFTYKNLTIKNDQSDKECIHAYQASGFRCIDLVIENTHANGYQYALNISNGLNHVEGCSFINAGLRFAKGLISRCTFNVGRITLYYGGRPRIEACTFYGAVGDAGQLDVYGYHDNGADVANCAFVGKTGNESGIFTNDDGQEVRLRNCVFKGLACAINHSGGGADQLPIIDSDYNCFYDCTKVAAWKGTDYTTLANWQAATVDTGLNSTGSPDANSIEGDPLLTDPGSGDFSLGAASPCRHAGAGAGVVTGINDEPFDPHNPDIGPWASGIGPNIAHGS